MNKYYTSYEDNDKRMDYLKYGLVNTRGINIDRKKVKQYNEDEITKIK